MVAAEPALSFPATLLLVQHYPDGGSMTGLLDLVRGLDRGRYRPVVTLRTPNPFVAELRDAGAEVVVLDDRLEIESEAAGAVRDPRPVARWGRRLAASPTRRELSRLIRRDIPHAWKLLRVVRQRGVDVIHANNDVLSNRDALIAGAVARVPTVVHTRWIHDYRKGPTLVVDRALARRAAHLVFMSQAIADSCRALRIPPDRVSVLDDPFDPADYTAAPSRAVSRELGLPAGARVVVHVGRLVPWKGQDVFLRAMALVITHEPQAIALVVGGGEAGTHAGFPRQLEQLAHDLGIGDRVVFAGRRRDVAQMLALSDAVVHSSTEPEPFGRVVVEAMAAGRAVVGADAGGVPEIIDHGATGLLVAPNDPPRLAEAIGGLLADPSAARAMGERARDAVRDRFSLRAHARAMEAIYDRVRIGRPARTRGR